MNLQLIKQQAIAALGFDRLNEIQERMLETAVTGRDVLLLSPTGSGKTLAFLLPVAAMEQEHGTGTTLILVPGRELALQIASVQQHLHTGLRCVACYGGHDLRIEQNALAAAAADKHTGHLIVVGTPGRIKDHMERGSFAPEGVTRLVLDEYDKSLELGFEEEMKAIVARLTGLRQRILTSATHNMPIAPYLGIKDYVTLDYTGTTRAAQHTTLSPTAPSITVRQVKSPVKDKLETLHDLLLTLPPEAQVIVFANYRESSERIAHYLSDEGIECALYHGGMEQSQREKALIRFRAQSLRVMVCTDLGSRGLDIPEVSHVIHYHLPTSEEACIHRNGRTARAGAEGTVTFIIGPDEVLPSYAGRRVTYFNLRPAEAFAPAPYSLIYIGRGRREKISRGDVLGFITAGGGIDGSMVGRIDVGEHAAYCAVRREVVADVLLRLKGLKIKGEKTHYLLVTGN